MLMSFLYRFCIHLNRPNIQFREQQNCKLKSTRKDKSLNKKKCSDKSSQTYIWYILNLLARSSLSIGNYNQSKSQNCYKYSEGKLVNIKMYYISCKGGYCKHYIKNYYSQCTMCKKDGMQHTFKRWCWDRSQLHNYYLLYISLTKKIEENYNLYNYLQSYSHIMHMYYHNRNSIILQHRFYLGTKNNKNLAYKHIQHSKLNNLNLSRQNKQHKEGCKLNKQSLNYKMHQGK